MKIAERALDLKSRTPSFEITQTVGGGGDEELIPCAFLRYVSNGVRDDLEQLAY